MSVRVNTYVMEGALFQYELLKDRFDHLEPFMDSAFEGIKHKDGVCVLFDGMNGDYVAVGRVIAKTGNHQHFEYGPISLTAPAGFEKQQELHDAICKVTGQDNVSLQFLVVSHYR